MGGGRSDVGGKSLRLEVGVEAGIESGGRAYGRGTASWELGDIR